MKAPRKVIFFISGPAPTEADLTAVDGLLKPRTNIVFRNASQIGDTDCLEKCDAVAGAVPSRYAAWPREDAAKAVTAMTPPPPPEGAVNLPLITPTPPAVPTPEDIEAFGKLSIEKALAEVGTDPRSVERAIQLEGLGKNRKSLIARLKESVK